MKEIFNIGTHRLKDTNDSKLKERLALLKQQKKMVLRRAVWRSCLIGGATGFLFWLANQPHWQITHPQQIAINGNIIVSNSTIYSLLAITYPQPIWELSTQKLKQNLEAASPIVAARVSRQILPSSIVISLQERIPVAIALKDGKLGFVDREGIWIPASFYRETKKDFYFPTLKLIGWQTQYRSDWQEFYRWYGKYPEVEIRAVDWRDRHNLSLETELGLVYLGSSSHNLSEKLAALSQLKDLPTQIELDEVARIDLSKPHSPTIEKIEKIEP